MNPPSWQEMTRVYGKIGLTSFGGPAAQIALMHKELVATRSWLTETDYLRALSLCMLLPGPEAMQLATYAGWRMRGVMGGLLAGLLFVIPGAVVIALLAFLYARLGDVPLVQAAFVGIKAAVIIVVCQALLKVARKALSGGVAWGLASGSFVALFAFGLPFPFIIAVAAIVGFVRTSDLPEGPPPATTNVRPARTLLVWVTLWATPLLLVWAAGQSFLLQLGLFFSKLAVVTFGGAYAVLAYMTQTVVQDYGWITTAQMIDALGLAETTPGPLILVTQFVAMLAGFAQSGVTGAVLAGLLALWVTFTPCFLWIFLAGPYLDQISARPRISGALEAITCAVVGVIANLSLWFALHVIFAKVDTVGAMPVPALHSFQPFAFVLTGLAAVLMLRFKIGFVPTMGIAAGIATLAGAM